jgi:hypothetical protein
MSDGDGERSHRYTWHVICWVPQVRWSHRYTWHEAVRSHKSDGDGKRSHRYTWHVSHQVPQVRCWRVLQVHIGWRKDRAKTFMTNCKHHGWVTVGPISTRRMEKGPTGIRHMEKGSSKDFYDELQASWMSNYRSHRYTSDGESTVWRSMTNPFIIDQMLFVTDVQLVQWWILVRHWFKWDRHTWVTRVIYDETLRSSMTLFVTIPNFVIEREGYRIVTTNLWWNGNIHHKKWSSMTILDSSLRFSS